MSLAGAELLEELTAGWPTGQEALAEPLARLFEAARSLPGVTPTLVRRPGISRSLRLGLATPPAGRSRPLFALLDVVEDADAWFVSLCFFADEINDPEELGDLIPEGLMGEDGYCFDLAEPDPARLNYLLARLNEAHATARR